MKKVRFLVALMLVVAALTVGVMAASTDYVAFETETIEVPAEAVTINIVSKNGFESAYASFNVDFDSTKWTISGLSAQGGVNGNRISWIYDTGITATANGTAFSFIATPIAGQNVEDSTFTLSECAIYNLAMDAAIMEDAGVFDTLTVVAAGPVATANTVEEPVEFDASDITIDGQVYENVAVFDGSIVIPVPGEGESITTAGIKQNGTQVYTFPSISGGGAVTYKVLFYGITDAEAEALAGVLKTFYTGMFID